MFRSTPPLKLLARIGSVIFALALTLALGGSTLAGQTLADRIGRLTFPVEFDFLTWTVWQIPHVRIPKGTRRISASSSGRRRGAWTGCGPWRRARSRNRLLWRWETRVSG